MEFKNNTKNQHFLSQAEQRMNAIDPSVSRQSMRIYAFDLVDRESYSVKLSSPLGMKIRKNLAIKNLYTFAHVDAHVQENFESLFGAYETRIELATRRLLTALDFPGADIKSEVIDIFALKLLNTFRNPYCIRKTLDTFRMLESVQPSDPLLAEVHLRVANLSTVDSHFIDELGVSRVEYEAWMDCLFLLLMKSADQPNFFELTIKGMFENSSVMKSIALYTYTGEAPGVLVSDRSFVDLSGEPFHFAYAFNLSASAFVFYSFVDIETQPWAPVSLDVMAALERAPLPVGVSVFVDDLDFLKKYNLQCVYQCWKQVFCSNPKPHGVDLHRD